MKCFHCKNKAVVHFTQDLCKKCFLRLLEARIRKYIRIEKLFQKGDNILIRDPLSDYLVKKIVGGLPVKYYKRNSSNINSIVIPWTIDDECCYFLERLFANKPVPKIKNVSVLVTVTDAEALAYAKLKNIKFKPNRKNQYVMEMLNSMEKKYKETKFSLVKSIKEMQNVL
jgi:hypothetical protein